MSTHMDAEEQQRRSASFDSVARAYAANRPGYPPEAVAWLTGEPPRRVLELGSGTGKLTTQLAASGHQVVATDPSPAMLAELRKDQRSVHLLVARAEHIPLRTSSVELVISAQAFHWFDPQRALPEIARVLRPGGVLSLVWNTADFKVPWVRKVMSLIEAPGDMPEDPLEASELFTTQDQRIFRHWQRFDRESLLGFVASSSYAAVMTPDERAALLGKVGDIYDSYGRGAQGMLMPWQARCYRATVSRLAARATDREPVTDDGLLIDFS